MKYFTNWSVYTIKVVMPILRLIYIFLHIDPISVVSLTVPTAHIFIVCPAIIQSQLLLCFFLLLYKSIIHLCSLLYNRRSAFNAPITHIALYSLHLLSHQRCWYWWFLWQYFNESWNYIMNQNSQEQIIQKYLKRSKFRSGICLGLGNMDFCEKKL